MLKVVISHSEDVDSSDAIKEILEDCQGQLGGLIPQAGILLAAIEHEHQVLVEKVMEAFPDLELIGCTTDGEVSSQLSFTEDAVLLALFYANNVEFRSGLGRNIPESPQAAAEEALSMAQKNMETIPKICFAFPEGLLYESVDTIEAMAHLLGKSTPIVGGGASDQMFLTGKTFQFYKNQVLQHSVPILLMGGEIQYSFGVNSGWTPVSKKSPITNVDGRIIYEIDHRPAVDFYQYYLGYASPSREYPLAVYDPGCEQFRIQGVYQWGDPPGSLSAYEKFQTGTLVQIAEASRDEIIEASGQSIKQAFEQFPAHHPDIAIVISCAARQALLGTRAKEEYQNVLKYSSDIPIFGFYAYGEICPLEKDGKTQYHNSTFVTILLGAP